ncbi:LOW QUALITY PROTEIN: hypothetical protein T265_14977 [Opisthorchis viverrini]|uniref:AMMECR1 domain-containing protein n=1 Tax=Opisthorchis viverrini TaxID=6198 RepID=A0A075A3E1_OPIVI|nr:LOW QUALITY PROTEIN: hypothetical protein T265_14977 [Opisthorchis viverrini]KER21924.1 LOW QUALITY PROTEIN: hypothetical protein T265_14977 [Opisthorchis viverrini]
MSRSRSSSSCFGAKKQRLDDEASSNKMIVPRNGLEAPGVIRREMCYYCLDVLHRHLYKADPPKPPITFPNAPYVSDTGLDGLQSAFCHVDPWKRRKLTRVRWNVQCLEYSSRLAGVRHYKVSCLSAISLTESAMRDSRFAPITEDEFPHLTCSVSLLLHFEEGKHYQDWQSINRSAVAFFRYLAAMPPEGSTRAGILSGCPSLDRGSREAEVGFEPRTFRSVNSRSNHLSHLSTSNGS